MNNLGVASTCCPDDGIHAVLLTGRAKIKSAVRLSGTMAVLFRCGKSARFFVSLEGNC